MAHRDNREFLTELRKEGLLKTVSTLVDWNEEIAAISQELMVGNGPAAHFNNIKDHNDTWCKELVLDTTMSNISRPASSSPCAIYTPAMSV